MNASAIEIDKKLREDFRRRLKDYGISAETTDPVLAVLFRTFSSQLENLYSETERIRLAVLDELIAGLGIEERRARPAQTIVRFFVDGDPQLVEAGTELLGEAESGQQLVFSTDALIAVSKARLALALIYQGGSLKLMPGVEIPEHLQSVRPSLEPVRINLGVNPAIFLAIEGLPANHLSQHSFFFELSPDVPGIHAALQTEPWCLFGHDGELSSLGILRPDRINAGIRRLTWLKQDGSLQEHAEEHEEGPMLPDGFYAGRTFIFPVVQPLRRFLCHVPRAMDTAMTKLFGRNCGQFFETPRAWLRLSMPQEIPDLQASIANVSIHAVSASNVECFNETVYLEKHGTSIPVSREAGTTKHLVAPLSIFGESGSAYLTEFQPSSNPAVGRYSIHNGRIHLRAARRPDNRDDAYVNLRLWVTAGSLGNKVGPGQVRTLLKPKGQGSLRIGNPTSAAGGTDGEGFGQAQARFAEALLSRARIVTRADLAAAVRAFDRRILSADLSSKLQRTIQGLRRIERVVVVLDRNDFLDAEEEVRVLRDELRVHLRERFFYDIDIEIDFQWK